VLEESFVKEQTTYDTWAALAATDAVNHLLGTFKIQPNVNFEELKEAVATASHQGEIQTNQGGTWEGEFYVKPAAAGTPPDIGPALIKAAMGVETITGGTDTTYTFSDTVQTALQAMVHVQDRAQKTFSGGVVQQMVIEIPANGLPTFKFSGQFARMGWAFFDENSAAEAQGVTEIAVADASRGCVQEPAMVYFEDDDNGAAGFTVTGHDWTSGSAHFDISPAIADAAGIGANEDIFPYAPSQTTGGSVIAAINNTLTFGSLSLGFIKCTVTVDTGLALRDKEATSDRAVGIVRASKRMVRAEFEFYALDSNVGNLPLMGYAHEGPTHDVDLTVGNASAAEMKLSWPKARLDIAQIESAESDVWMASATLVARQSAAACDEFSIEFD
jgi:hypothetical protein